MSMESSNSLIKNIAMASLYLNNGSLAGIYNNLLKELGSELIQPIDNFLYFFATKTKLFTMK